MAIFSLTPRMFWICSMVVASASDSANLSAARCSARKGVTQSQPPAPTQLTRKKRAVARNGSGLRDMIHAATANSSKSPTKNGHLDNLGVAASVMKRMFRLYEENWRE